MPAFPAPKSANRALGELPARRGNSDAAAAWAAKRKAQLEAAAAKKAARDEVTEHHTFKPEIRRSKQSLSPGRRGAAQAREVALQAPKASLARVAVAATQSSSFQRRTIAVAAGVADQVAGRVTETPSQSFSSAMERTWQRSASPQGRLQSPTRAPSPNESFASRGLSGSLSATAMPSSMPPSPAPEEPNEPRKRRNEPEQEEEEEEEPKRLGGRLAGFSWSTFSDNFSFSAMQDEPQGASLADSLLEAGKRQQEQAWREEEERFAEEDRQLAAQQQELQRQEQAEIARLAQTRTSLEAQVREAQNVKRKLSSDRSGEEVDEPPMEFSSSLLPAEMEETVEFMSVPTEVAEIDQLSEQQKLEQFNWKPGATLPTLPERDSPEQLDMPVLTMQNSHLQEEQPVNTESPNLEWHLRKLQLQALQEQQMKELEQYQQQWQQEQEMLQQQLQQRLQPIPQSTEMLPGIVEEQPQTFALQDTEEIVEPPKLQRNPAEANLQWPQELGPPPSSSLASTQLDLGFEAVHERAKPPCNRSKPPPVPQLKLPQRTNGEVQQTRAAKRNRLSAALENLQRAHDEEAAQHAQQLNRLMQFQNRCEDFEKKLVRRKIQSSISQGGSVASLSMKSGDSVPGESLPGDSMASQRIVEYASFEAFSGHSTPFEASPVPPSVFPSQPPSLAGSAAGPPSSLAGSARGPASLAGSARIRSSGPFDVFPGQLSQIPQSFSNQHAAMSATISSVTSSQNASFPSRTASSVGLPTSLEVEEKQRMREQRLEVEEKQRIREQMRAQAFPENLPQSAPLPEPVKSDPYFSSMANISAPAPPSGPTQLKEAVIPEHSLASYAQSFSSRSSPRTEGSEEADLSLAEKLPDLKKLHRMRDVLQSMGGNSREIGRFDQLVDRLTRLVERNASRKESPYEN